MSDHELIRQYRLMHQNPKRFVGRSLLRHTNTIKTIIDVTGAKTILDYGSGKGHQYSNKKVNEIWGVDVTCYDPGVLEFSKLPSCKFDGVICTDVLEHIQEEDLDSVIKTIFEHANMFVFIAVYTEKSKKFLPDGRNCHLTVRPGLWWGAKVAAIHRDFPGIRYDLVAYAKGEPE